MRWRGRWARKFEWHRWYAWRPVDIDGKTYWLEWIYRQRYSIGLSPFLYWRYSATRPLQSVKTGGAVR